MKTPGERKEFGKGRRDAVSRKALGELRPKERRFDPVQVLLAADADRLPELRPLKYYRMSRSPFAFFRGAVSIMAADLARQPHSGLRVQLCGDAHLQNLGSFAAPDGQLIFDLNDFDETLHGPWEWDVKRMATSIILAGREAKHKRSAWRAAAETFVESYCDAMARFARQPILQVVRHFIRRGEGGRPLQAALLHSERAKPLDMLEKYTHADGKGERCFRDLRPIGWRVTGQEARDVLASLKPYRETLSPERRGFLELFRPVDVGFKVVGTGSVGLRDYVVLLEGNGAKDPLFLQVKQEVRSAYAPHLADLRYEHQGRRAAEGQRAMQPVSDLLLGWTSCGGNEYLVRQLNDRKGGIDLRTLRGGGLESLAVVAGELLARGHARTGDLWAIHGYCGGGSKIVKALRKFASLYADQSEADYVTFLAAIQSKKVKIAETE